MAETRTLSDDIYDALGMPGTWWMGRARLAEHIADKLSGKQVSIERHRGALGVIDAKNEDIEALKSNIDDLQTENAILREHAPSPIGNAKPLSGNKRTRAKKK